MNPQGMTDKQQAITLIESMPDDVTLDEIMYHIDLCQKIAEGESDLKEGRVIDHEEVVRRMQKWRTDPEGE